MEYVGWSGIWRMSNGGGGAVAQSSLTEPKCDGGYLQSRLHVRDRMLVIYRLLK